MFIYNHVTATTGSEKNSMQNVGAPIYSHHSTGTLRKFSAKLYSKVLLETRASVVQGRNHAIANPNPPADCAVTFVICILMYCWILEDPYIGIEAAKVPVQVSFDLTRLCKYMFKAGILEIFCQPGSCPCLPGPCICPCTSAMSIWTTTPAKTWLKVCGTDHDLPVVCKLPESILPSVELQWCTY